MNWDTPFIGDDMQNAPTDIIGLGDIGSRIAEMLENIVGIKEICYFSRKKENKKYHFMEFNDMLSKCEYMFVTLSKNKESLALFDDLSRFNRNMKVIIVANGFEEIARRLADKCEKGELGGVAFESDDLSKDYRSNVFVTPHNAYYTKKATSQMFETWVNTIISACEESINIVN